MVRRRSSRRRQQRQWRAQRYFRRLGSRACRARLRGARRGGSVRGGLHGSPVVGRLFHGGQGGAGARSAGGCRGSSREEEAEARQGGEEQGGGGVPAKDPHCRRAQPPPPDERLPRRAPRPHAALLRSKGRPSVDRWRGNQLREGAGAAPPIARGPKERQDPRRTPQYGPRRPIPFRRLLHFPTVLHHRLVSQFRQLRRQQCVQQRRQARGGRGRHRGYQGGRAREPQGARPAAAKAAPEARRRAAAAAHPRAPPQRHHRRRHGVVLLQPKGGGWFQSGLCGRYCHRCA